MLTYGWAQKLKQQETLLSVCGTTDGDPLTSLGEPYTFQSGQREGWWSLFLEAEMGRGTDSYTPEPKCNVDEMRQAGSFSAANSKRLLCAHMREPQLWHPHI